MISYEVNEKTEIAFNYFNLYKDVTDLLQMSENYHPRKFEIETFLKLERIYKRFKTNYDLDLSTQKIKREIEEQILTHIEGIILGPTLVNLDITGMFHKYFMESRFKPEEFHKNYQDFDRLLKILTDLELFEFKNDTYAFTDKGLFFTKRASAYGVTVSYIPTLRKLDHLIFGDQLILKHP